jgi:hypothetical protein
MTPNNIFEMWFQSHEKILFYNIQRIILTNLHKTLTYNISLEHQHYIWEHLQKIFVRDVSRTLEEILGEC